MHVVLFLFSSFAHVSSCLGDVAAGTDSTANPIHVGAPWSPGKMLPGNKESRLFL